MWNQTIFSSWLTPETARLLWHGIVLTVVLTLITSALALALGVAAGACRLSNNRFLRWIAAVHIEIHRNVPALVLIIFWAFAVPNLVSPPLRQPIFFDNAITEWLSSVTGLPLVYYVLAAILGLTLNTSAYLAELFRAGVGTIAQEHTEAARSLGASRRVVFWRILLPQGLAAAFPAIATRLIHNMKNTALAAFVSVPELFHSVLTAITRTFHAVQFLLLAAALYLALSALFSLGLGWVERRLHRRPAQPRPIAATQGSHV
jgi:polar amino acid transport system permease protein